MAGAAASEFSAVFWRADYLADWDLDDSGGYELAGLQADGVGAAAGDDQLCGADSYVRLCSGGGGLGGSSGPAEGAGLDAGAEHGAVAGAGGVDAFTSHYDSDSAVPERDAGDHQCVRYAGAAVVHD